MSAAALACALTQAGASRPARAAEARELVLFVDGDDENDDGIIDGRQNHVESSEIRWLDGPASRGASVRLTHGQHAVRVMTEQGPLELGAGHTFDANPRRVGLQGLVPGRARVELGARAFDLRVYEARAFDTSGRPVDLAGSHASLSRTLAASLRPEEERGEDADALRWVLIGPERGIPQQLTILSVGADGAALDALRGVELRPSECPALAASGVSCRTSPLVRATVDWLDRSHPRAAELSLRAQVGGRLVVLSDGMKVASVRVGGPRQSRLGSLERYRAKLRVRVLRNGTGAGVAIGADAQAGLEMVRREVESANAIWGQCGVQFGNPAELDVAVVDPPPPHMFAVGCGLGLPASGGQLAFRVGRERLQLRVPAGASAERVAHALSTELSRRGFQVALSPNPKETFAAQASIDVLVRGPKGEYVELDLPRVERSRERTLEVCLGAVNLSDGLLHFSDADAATGTVEERTLLKALIDDDPATIDVLIVPYFVTMGRIGESFVEARGMGVRNAIIVDRAAVRAGGRSFALAHELGHVLLQVAGHPDDFGTDLPTRLMDADAADATVFGPRRLSLGECERAILQSGPRAPLPLLEAWPLVSAPRSGGNPAP